MNTLISLHNYCTCCSEISKAQDRLTDMLQNVFINHSEYRELLRMIMSTVGRGGEGDVGQRIRDEILVIQVMLVLILLDPIWFLSHISFCRSIWILF